MVEAYKPLYTAKQVSQILLVNVATVYELMNKGQLPYLNSWKRKWKQEGPGKRLGEVY